MCPIENLVEEFERRGKLRMLETWLQTKYDQRIVEPSLHNALAKIYVDTGNKDT
jgi:clathrin heavy chain